MKYNLDNLVLELENLEKEMSNPDIFKDQKKVREVSARKKMIEKAVDIYKIYKSANESLEENKEMLNTEKDEEMRELLKEDIHQLEEKIPELEEELKIELLPKDPNDDKNIIVEVRAGTGGEEAALFAGELAKSYMIFAENEGYKVEITEQSDAEAGGIKEIIFEVKGEGAYSKFKYESGTHRVQRIPATESKGRVHTSAITVAIMPEVDEIDIDIKEEDVEMKFTRSSGAGGQHVNKTDSAVQLKHIPTGIMVFCQDGRSQHKNREKARAILRSKLYAYEEEKRAREMGEARLAQVGSGDRSEKIRTYNFPQDRVTDHRIGQNFSGIPQIMMGKLGHIIEALSIADRQAKLEAAGKGQL
ncbi:peptide chain release factor 1 [Candidatus Gracilibacteria bacterium HOT-871]|nr:peptide chain release factor 1 [Candidatus Gracilibacteria bacterium HOT-871]MBB1564555.1 peptide chain release factor 1 [Candidatus Gracilibacteria bacterium]RKW21612.1 MAG: peptide chain release factor 1 [Candidatus Gracilibacteria bacterium]